MATYDAGSYRDREGRVFYGESGRVLRALSAEALRGWEAVSASSFCRQAMACRKIIGTKKSDTGIQELQAGSEAAGSPEAAPWAGVLEHERIPFISYPYEWPFGMLQDSALLQLELLQAALAEDFILKDGTAYNVQWLGSRPVFIDVVSFERLTAGQPWAGYRQFCQTSLFPLMLQAYKDFGYHALLRGRLEGISPSDCAHLMSWRDVLRPGVLAHVVLHSRLEGSQTVRDSNLQKALPRAGFGKALIASNAANLAQLIRRLGWAAPSPWTGYAEQNTYSESDSRAKREFVRAAASAAPIGQAWDLGCNVGEYSRIVAEQAQYVVAMDADHPTVERLYQRLKAEGDSELSRKILPLVANLADPSPGQGWRGAERKSLFERGRPDLILCLALVHHLVIGAGIPLRELLAWFAGLGGRLVIEFVEREDPMVKRLLQNRRDPCIDYEASLFERWLNEFFDVQRSERLSSGTRVLYFALPRS